MTDTEHSPAHGPDIEVPEPATIRRIHRTIEPIHSIVYFTPEADRIYGALGLDARSGYFASRSAALGPVPAQVVTALFYNFSPDLVARSLDGVWERTSPAAVLTARLEVADTALRTNLGADTLTSADMVRAAELARTAAEEATDYLEGRALFAAHAALDWPEAPHLVLWHAASLLREFRGDAHVAALLSSGLDGLDAIVVDSAARKIPAEVLRTTRGWSTEAWSRTVDLHRSTGWIAAEAGPDGDAVVTDDGADQREAIEAATDRGSTLPWLAIGTEGIDELRTLVRPWARTLSDALFAHFTR